MTLAIQLIQDLAVILLSATAAGWICSKIHISKVVGYLFAGIIIGTPQITLIYVTDAERIQTLSQLGLVFLMFFVGLQFRIRKIRELGIGVVLATIFTAIVTISVTRTTAALLGYSEAESLFLAGMIVVSSSAIISRVLEEYKLNHSRAGQLAMGVTLLEDMVAIVMLAWLGSYTATESAGASAASWIPLLKTIGLLAAFVAIVIVIGLLFIPRWSKRADAKGDTEAETLLVAGLMFFMAFLTVRSGFSLALGAFLCGVIISESTRARSITVNFSGLKDIFVTVFFTAIGMSIDIVQLPDALPLILLGVVLAMVVRVVASSVGFLLVAEDEKTALRAGLSLTPIGEFSFVIAGMGISAGVLNSDFQIAAVGISFVTSLLSPQLIKQSDRIAGIIRPSRIKPLGRALALYREMWANLDNHRKRNLLARFVTPRLLQIGREVLLVTGILIFARPGYSVASRWIQDDFPAAAGLVQIYWLLIFLICLFPLVALLRNGNALAMIVSEYFVGSQPSRKALRHSFTYLLRTIGIALAGIWFFNFIPTAWIDRYVLVGLLILTVIGAILSWRFLVGGYNHVEITLSKSIAGGTSADAPLRNLQESSSEWKLTLVEFLLPDSSQFAGKSVAEIGLRYRTDASVIGIERQGYQLSSIGPNTHIFPGDLIYLLGETESLEKARELLSEAKVTRSTTTNLAAAVLDQIIVPADSPWVGSNLGSLQWSRLHGVQVVGVRRDEVPHLSPDAEWVVRAGDILLLAGTQPAINALRAS